MKTIIGIDPGKNGAIVAWIPGVELDIRDTSLTSIANLIFRLRGVSNVHIYLEQVHASQQMGVSSAFNFGIEYGKMVGAFECTTHLLNYVTPQKWQAALNCRTGGDKKISKVKAKGLFPDIKVTHKNADALLIAYYGMLKEREL